MTYFLSPEGRQILSQLEKHCEMFPKAFAIDSLELAMLANSFDMYAKAAAVCHEKGISVKFKKGEDKEGGVYEQIRPEYTVMKTEYSNILKHGPKFGLNPAARESIFKKLMAEQGEKKKKGFDTDTELKVAK